MNNKYIFCKFINRIFEIIVYVTGELDGHLESQGGIVIPILIDHSGDNIKCVLKPNLSGPHALYLDFAGFPLPGSPFPALVESSAAGVRVDLSGSGLTTAICGHQAEFTIDGSQAGPGMLTVTNKFWCDVFLPLWINFFIFRHSHNHLSQF